MPEYRVRDVAGLKENEKRVVSAGRARVLVLRHSGKLIGFQDKCPHAGGPLEKGAICNGRLICPWHMATFSLHKGQLIHPPAMESLQTYSVRERDDGVFVRVPPVSGTRGSQDFARSTTDRRTFMIVGSGAAGSMAAKTLRDEGFCGKIIVVDPHPEEPVDRTMLTKMALTDSTPVKRLQLHSLDALDVIRLKAPINSLYSSRGRATLSNGKSLQFDAALIATGGKPKLLPMRGSDAVYTIRHVDDLRRLRSAAQANRHAVIVGTSFIGMEAASALRQRGLKVTVIGKETLPFEKQLGPQIASSLLSLHKKKGVRFILGARLIQIANRYVLVEESGRERQIDADLVILGVGVSPNLDFEHDLPLAAEGGVLTDKSLRAADKVWVAGDIASISGIRIEHWRVAQQHGMHAAMQMLGQKGSLHIVPFFWTYHFGKRINYLGRGEEWNDISMTGDLRSFNFLALQSKSGVVRSVISCGRETETALLAELLHRPLSKQGAHTALRRL